MKISSEDAAVILRDAAAKIESGQYDPRALLLDWLPPVHHFLHAQTMRHAKPAAGEGATDSPNARFSALRHLEGAR